LDCGRLQTSLDNVKSQGFWELVELVHGNDNVGAWCLKNLLAVAHVESISQITVDIALAAYGCIFFSIF
jgi:hypothetical protein